MHLTLSSTRRLTAAGFLVGLVVGTAVGITGDPIYRYVLAWIYQEPYATLVFKCDEAMREHYLAKARAGVRPNQENATLLAESEVALVDCHEYDRLRKRLRRLGLKEEDLAAMGLQAIEERGADIRKIVRQHEIRY